LKLEYTDTTPEKEMQYKELKEKYEVALANLGEKQRVVFLMSRLEGLKYTEIAERLGISVKAVEKRMNGALGTFRQVLTTLINLLYLSTLADRILLFINNSEPNV
jgi:RNA polymerase sigma-70 factor (ECF subfamily)